jgi:signal transduction histidine kinase
VTGCGEYHSEYRVIRPTDGRTLWLEEWGSAMPDAAGVVQKVVGVTMDVTDRKQAEIALQQLNATLEQRVAERTAELEQINRELVQFTSVVSHDLRAPLRAITTLSEWIGEESAPALSPQARKHLSKIQQRVLRMDTMLNDLVSYTRAGRVRYKVEQVNTALLVKDIINLLDAPPGFTFRVVEPMPILMTESIPLETVLLNLIGNALKHHHHPENGQVSICARDLGERVEFQTLRPRDEVEGSGMGLAIAKRLVEARGGVLEVKSNVGQGSTFRFTWPKQNV